LRLPPLRFKVVRVELLGMRFVVLLVPLSREPLLRFTFAKAPGKRSVLEEAGLCPVLILFLSRYPTP